VAPTLSGGSAPKGPGGLAAPSTVAIHRRAGTVESGRRGSVAARRGKRVGGQTTWWATVTFNCPWPLRSAAKSRPVAGASLTICYADQPDLFTSCHEEVERSPSAAG